MAVKPSPTAIRQARIDNPTMRERELAAQLAISEAEFVAAWCGDSATRLDVRVGDLLKALPGLGEVMALTRNESAVHEKIGVYENITAGDVHAIVLGTDIDLRIFPKVWAHGFAVRKRDGEHIRHSLQFFDEAGAAVHKVHLRPASNLHAYLNLVDRFASADQSPFVRVGKAAVAAVEEADASAEELRARWSRMTDVHQFFGLLQALKLTRRQAVRMVGKDYAWPLDPRAVPLMMERAAANAIPLMCFVGSAGCIQIHSGPISSVKPMGPWINVMDETFHLHLRTDHIREVWGVRKPTKDGHVTSLEAFDADGNMIIQFFGKRHEGEHELEDWRALIENLPHPVEAPAIPTAA